MARACCCSSYNLIMTQTWVIWVCKASEKQHGAPYVDACNEVLLLRTIAVGWFTDTAFSCGWGESLEINLRSNCSRCLKQRKKQPNWNPSPEADKTCGRKDLIEIAGGELLSKELVRLEGYYLLRQATRHKHPVISLSGHHFNIKHHPGKG